MNIRDVAKKARVSTATVSRVMSGIDVVKPDTAKRVLKAIDALSYVPNLSARTLSMGRSHLFGMVISDITNPFYPDMIFTFSDLAEQHHYRAVFANTNYSPERMERSIIGLLEQKVEGIAIMTSEISENSVRMIADRGIPVTSLHESFVHDNLSHVAVDYQSGMKQAIDHLTSLGHKEIAFIAGPQELRSAAERQAIFMTAMKDRGLEINHQSIIVANHRVDGGRSAMQKLLQQKPLPTAVMCSNDLTAIGAITAICDAGLSVPGDLSVVGYDDIDIAAAFNPALTTVRLSRADIATRAFVALFKATNPAKELMMPERFASNAQPKVPTELVLRKSTAPPRMA